MTQKGNISFGVLAHRAKGNTASHILMFLQNRSGRTFMPFNALIKSTESSLQCFIIVVLLMCGSLPELDPD